MLIFNTKVLYLRKIRTMIFNNIFIHRNAYERFNSNCCELTKIVHRANSLTTFRLLYMYAWERVKLIDLHIFMESLTRSFEDLNYIPH